MCKRPACLGFGLAVQQLNPPRGSSAGNGSAEQHRKDGRLFFSSLAIAVQRSYQT